LTGILPPTYSLKVDVRRSRRDFVKTSKKQRKPRQAAILGLGFDDKDGQTRLTRGKNFVLYGGSQETHAQMQETAIKINEHLDRRGKQLEEVSPRELHDIYREVTER
jgi:hypothetical protein